MLEFAKRLLLGERDEEAELRKVEEVKARIAEATRAVRHAHESIKPNPVELRAIK